MKHIKIILDDEYQNEAITMEYDVEDDVSDEMIKETVEKAISKEQRDNENYDDSSMCEAISNCTILKESTAPNIEEFEFHW